MEAFDAHFVRLQSGIDVLIQIAEDYYVMSELRGERAPLDGGNTFGLIRHSIGFEIVSRIYRIADTASDGKSLGALKKKYLQDHDFKNHLFSKYNHDGRKDRDEFDRRFDVLIRLIDDLCQSPEMNRVRVFRTRYTGHMIDEPRILEKLGPDADVDVLSSADMQKLIESISDTFNRICYLHKRTTHPFGCIAKQAREDALMLWKADERWES